MPTPTLKDRIKAIAIFGTHEEKKLVGYQCHITGMQAVVVYGGTITLEQAFDMLAKEHPSMMKQFLDKHYGDANASL